MRVNVVCLLLILWLGYISSEIKVTFSNEEDDEQSFIVKTDSPVGGSGNSPDSGVTDSDLLKKRTTISKLKIVKGDLILLEKSIADIGREGYDMDIDSDLLDIGENELELLLYSSDGTLIQKEKISVFSPPADQNETGVNSNSDDVMSESGTSKTFRNSLIKKWSSLQSRINSIIANDKHRRIVAATCGTIGIATGGALYYTLQSKRYKTHSESLNKISSLQSGMNFGKKNEKYVSKFPRYPMLVSGSDYGCFSKATTTTFTDKGTKATSLVGPRSLTDNTKELLLGQPRRTSFFIQGGLAVLGVKVAKELVVKLSNRDDSDKRGSIFQLGKSKAKKGWRMGRFFSR